MTKKLNLPERLPTPDRLLLKELFYTQCVYREDIKDVSMLGLIKQYENMKAHLDNDKFKFTIIAFLGSVSMLHFVQLEVGFNPDSQWNIVCKGHLGNINNLHVGTDMFFNFEEQWIKNQRSQMFAVEDSDLLKMWIAPANTDKKIKEMNKLPTSASKDKLIQQLKEIARTL